MSLEPAVQRAAGEPERLRRVAHVAGRARQRLLNEHPLHVLEAHLVERRGTVRPGAEPQVARSYRALLGHQHGPLDRVVELPHVPGPGIRPEGLHRVRREAANRLPVTRGVAAPEMAGEQGNVLAPLAQRWQAEFDGIRRNNRSCRNFPAAASAWMSAFVAEMTRTFTRCVLEEPTRSNSPVSSTRNSFACCGRGKFAISSRNSVPPSASSNRPTRSTFASVKAPFTCPNSSLSNRPSGMPPKLTATRGRSARPEAACSQRATTSLPVPCS